VPVGEKLSREGGCLLVNILKNITKSVFLIASSSLGWAIIGFLFSLILFHSLHPQFYLYTFALLAKPGELTIFKFFLALLYLSCFLLFIFVFPFCYGLLGGRRAMKIALVRYFIQQDLLDKIIKSLCFLLLPEDISFLASLSNSEKWLKNIEDRFSTIFAQIIWQDGQPKGWLRKMFYQFLESNFRVVFLKELRETVFDSAGNWRFSQREEAIDLLQQKVRASLIMVFQPNWDYFFLTLAVQLIIYFSLSGLIVYQ